MELKSNLDIRTRLKIACQNIDKVEDILCKHASDTKKTEPMMPRECNGAINMLSDAFLAIGVISAQMAGHKAEHCLNFPSQNKQLRSLCGNHHVIKIDKITKHGNKLILQLGKKRKAMTAYIDVLNDSKYRKDYKVEGYQGNIKQYLLPKNRRLRNVIPKDV